MNKTLENGKISNVNGPENLILQKYLFHRNYIQTQWNPSQNFISILYRNTF